MNEIVKILKERNQTVSFAESMTGGAIASSMVLVSHASDVLRESLIVYSNEAKVKYLEISEKDIEKYGVVSAEIAALMVEHYHRLSKSDLVVSVTGYAEGKLPNEAYIGIYYDGESLIKHLVFDDTKTRIENIKKCVKEVTKLMKKVLKN